MSAPQPFAMRATGTIRCSRFVKMDSGANNSVKEADANEQTIGISQAGGRVAPIPEVTTTPVEAAQSGENLQVFALGQSCLLEIGSGGCSPGSKLKSDADGKGVAIATGTGVIQRIGAIALESASASEFAMVQVVLFSETEDQT